MALGSCVKKPPFCFGVNSVNNGKRRVSWNVNELSRLGMRITQLSRMLLLCHFSIQLVNNNNNDNNNGDLKTTNLLSYA